MKLQQIYDLFVTMGMDNDPRGRVAVEAGLKKRAKEYEQLGKDEKAVYDIQRLTNPYADTRILYGDPEADIRSVITGIDMETAEVVLADRLREQGEGIDLIIAHHPEGWALAHLDLVMPVQADIWHSYGVPINAGDMMIGSRMKEVQRGFLPVNHTRAIDAAKLLDLPFMCAHTVADNMVQTYLTTLFDNKQPETVKDVVGILKDIPEYKAAETRSIGPMVLVGSESTRAGTVMVDMTGGTGGPKDAITRLAEAGVGTIVGMHMSDKNREEAEKHNLNVVIAGHISSDSVGMNLLLDAIEAQGVAITPCSGLIRFSRA